MVSVHPALSQKRVMRRVSRERKDENARMMITTTRGMQCHGGVAVLRAPAALWLCHDRCPQWVLNG